MSKKALLKKKAKLESINDQLFAELAYVDQLMRLIGFPEGLETVKATAEALKERFDEEYD